MSYSKPNSALFTLEDERVVVLGAGRSGVAAANLAAARGAEVRLFDSRPDPTPQGLDARVTLIGNATPEMGVEIFSDYLVTSPGVDTYGELVKAFATNTMELLGELELGYRFYGGTCVGITGTNGKTTTTEIIAHLIKKLGFTAEPCGNHGVPLSELVLGEAPEYAVVEISSFQLETISTFRSAVSLWLNLAPDHLDRYPDFEAYRAAKERIFEPLLPTDWKITREEEGYNFPQSHLTFSASSSSANYSYADGLIQMPGAPAVDLASTRLRGLHNVENAMAAFAVINALGLDWTAPPAALLADYQPPAHRCELIRDLDGVGFINDSKSTNLHSLETALSAFEQPLVLIVGGKEKGFDYNIIKGKLANNIKVCLTIGETGLKLAELFSDEVETYFCNSLENAVVKARSFAEEGDYVLFSPGTSSFDMFSSYIERGEAFRKIVHSL